MKFSRLFRSAPSLSDDPISIVLDQGFYRSAHSDLAGVNLQEHFLLHGFWEGRAFNPLVDLDVLASFRMKHYADTATRVDAANEAMAALLTGDLNPNALFDKAWMRRKYGFEHPFLEYLKLPNGERQKMQTSLLFDGAEYCRRHPDVAAAGDDPLAHYLLYGEQEGREFASSDFFDPDFAAGAAFGLGLDLSNKKPTSLIKASAGTPGFIAGPAHVSGDRPALTNIGRRSIVSVGIVLYKTQYDELTDLLDSLDRAATIHELHVLIRANDGLDYSSALSDHKVAVRIAGDNVGFCVAHNQLMDVAFSNGANYYICANPDGFFTHDFFDRIVAFSQHFKDQALVEAGILPIEHPKWYNPLTFDTAWVSGACVLIPKTIYDAIGGFDPDIFMYCDDVDLSWRAKDAGFSAKVCPTACFFHDVTSKERDETAQRRRLMLEGARQLAFKWRGDNLVQQIEAELRSSRLVDEKHPLRELYGKVRDRRTSPNSTFDYSLRFSPSRFWK